MRAQNVRITFNAVDSDTRFPNTAGMGRAEASAPAP
jgi:hypothetical protein